MVCWYHACWYHVCWYHAWCMVHVGTMHVGTMVSDPQAGLIQRPTHEPCRHFASGCPTTTGLNTHLSASPHSDWITEGCREEACPPPDPCQHPLTRSSEGCVPRSVLAQAAAGIPSPSLTPTSPAHPALPETRLCPPSPHPCLAPTWMTAVWPRYCWTSPPVRRSQQRATPSAQPVMTVVVLGCHTMRVTTCVRAPHIMCANGCASASPRPHHHLRGRATQHACQWLCECHTAGTRQRWHPARLESTKKATSEGCIAFVVLIKSTCFKSF